MKYGYLPCSIASVRGEHQNKIKLCLQKKSSKGARDYSPVITQSSVLSPQHCIDWAGTAVYIPTIPALEGGSRGNQFEVFFAYEASLDYMRPGVGGEGGRVAKVN